MIGKIRIGVVGAGTMGRGIAQLFAQAGHPVSVFDSMNGAAGKGSDAIAAVMNTEVQKGRRTRAETDGILASITVCGDLRELAPCELIIEAIVEDVGVKQALFTALEDILSRDAIMVTNTSSLLVAEIAAKCRYPERFAGLHFFNPVPLMKVVEIVCAIRTSVGTVQSLRDAVASTGHRAVVVADQPGFLVNHAGRGYYTEALRILEEQVATHADIDQVLREAAGFRMGPFELLDLTGLDVSGRVMESIYSQFHHEPRFRPSSLVPPRIAAGLYGRKTGEGWYDYARDVKAMPPAIHGPPPRMRHGLKVWIDPTAAQHAGLYALALAAGGRRAESAEDADLLIIQPWGRDASGYCVQLGLDARRCVAIDPLPGLDFRITLMLSVLTEPVVRDAAIDLLGTAGKSLTVINDSPGFVVQRVLAMLVNIAANIAQRRIAAVDDIEDAVRLGLGYPHGPLGWGDRIGGDKILTILHNMQMVTGDPRYRPSPWLARRAGLGVSLLTAEAARA